MEKIILKAYHDDTPDAVVDRIASLVKPLGVEIKYIPGERDGIEEWEINKIHTEHYLVIAGNEFGVTERKLFKHNEEEAAKAFYDILKGVEFHAELKFIDTHGKETVLAASTDI